MDTKEKWAHGLGDRVAMYGNTQGGGDGAFKRQTGEVVLSIGEDAYVTWVNVRPDGEKSWRTYHVKQLRRLRKRVVREWSGEWLKGRDVHPNADVFVPAVVSLPILSGPVRVREVLK